MTIIKVNELGANLFAESSGQSKPASLWAQPLPPALTAASGFPKLMKPLSLSALEPVTGESESTYCPKLLQKMMPRLQWEFSIFLGPCDSKSDALMSNTSLFL